MGEEDDDEGFGDFKFAPTFPNPATTFDPNPKINGRDSADDDDWGDFITPHANQINVGFEFSEDPFGYSVKNESLMSPVESVSSRADSAKAQWVKPQGALPLSLFGEMEEDEEERNLEPMSLWSMTSPQIKSQNGSDQKLNSDGENSNSNGSSINFNGLRSDTNGFDSNYHGMNSISSRLDSNVDGVKMISNGLNSNSTVLNTNVSDINSNTSMFDSKIDGMNWNSNGFDSDLVKQSEDLDDDDDGWEFKGAETEKQDQGIDQLPGLKREGKVKEAGHTFGFGRGDNGPIDLSTPSNGTSQGTGERNLVFDFKPSSFAQDDLFSGSYSKSKKNEAGTGSHVPQVVKNVDSNENFWHFKDAYSKTQPMPLSEEAKVSTPVDLERHTTTDFFAEPKRSFHNSGDWNSAFTFNPVSVTVSGIISDSYSSGKKHDIAGVTSSPDDKHDESDDNVWEFKDAITETGPKHEGESVISHSPPTDVVPPEFDSKIQSNDAILENNRKALPISLFGDEELETNESSFHQDVSNIPAFPSTNSIKTPSSSLSINDLISSLYSQVEHNTSENHVPTVSENGMYSATRVVELDLVKHDDDFDDDSWEFKDAFANSQVHDQTSIASVEDSSTKSSTKLQLNDCLDFYSKLKDESCFVAMSHLENLKKAQNSAILSGEEAKAKALGEEFQEVYNQLRQDNMTAKECQLENLSPRNACLSEVLLEPKFKVLESEYQLSEQLSMAEKDLRSATELSKHASLALKILKLGSVEVQSNYVSTWSRIFSVCALELKHGASIWEQSLEKNVHSQILSEPQGRQYIHALGEIYRVVEVLGASAKVYKPWLLLGSADSSGLFALLNECTTLWSSSGLDVALQKISEPIDSDHDRTIKALLESLNHIHDLDALALQNQIFLKNNQHVDCQC
ncbi:hypothetical protein FNV43_RR04905 [Rhamnella rubrinervis]|uniref:Synergin gamma C-terminal domain-containing protein n=1 Tax=Rhamnella rubrinervis TaxID=2594499 RepID=A0A8K0HLZ9_9ROSA|nr:hypothetical protein FNV43_RR04905 [Rhamnella rubrinervis]